MNIWDKERDITIDEARSLILEQFPGLAPVEITELGEGFDNTVYKVNEEYVFRFPRREVAVELLETEGRILPAIARTCSIQISEPLFYGEPTDDFPGPFLGYRLLLGNIPYQITLEQRVKSAKVIAVFLKELHSFPTNGSAKRKVPFDQMRRLDMVYRKPKLENYITELTKVETEVDLNALQKLISSYPHVPVPDKTVLVHGDLHVRNVLTNEDGIISGIIDWGDVHFGHPAVDLSFVYSFLPPEGRHLFYQNYGEVDQDTRHLARFRAISLSVVLLLYAHDKKDGLLIDAARQSLLLSIEV